jgi:hypothetical protein
LNPPTEAAQKKRLHVLDSKLKISAAPPLHGKDANLQETTARRPTKQRHEGRQNNDTKADNPNGTKVDNPNSMKAYS